MPDVYFNDLGGPDPDLFVHTCDIIRQVDTPTDFNGSSLGTTAIRQIVVASQVPCLVVESDADDKDVQETSTVEVSGNVYFAQDYGLDLDWLIRWTAGGNTSFAKPRFLRVSSQVDVVSEGVVYTVKFEERKQPRYAT